MKQIAVGDIIAGFEEIEQPWENLTKRENERIKRKTAMLTMKKSIISNQLFVVKAAN